MLFLYIFQLGQSLQEFVHYNLSLTNLNFFYLLSLREQKQKEAAVGLILI